MMQNSRTKVGILYSHTILRCIKRLTIRDVIILLSEQFVYQERCLASFSYLV